MAFLKRKFLKFVILILLFKGRKTNEKTKIHNDMRIYDSVRP